MSVQRKNRTLNLTVNELLESPRLRIAVENFNADRQLLKAILIELGFGAMQVAKNKIIKVYASHSSLCQRDMIPLLRSTNDFDKFDLYWSLSPEEIALYTIDPKFKLPKEERLELQEKVRQKFMES